VTTAGGVTTSGGAIVSGGVTTSGGAITSGGVTGFGGGGGRNTGGAGAGGKTGAGGATPTAGTTPTGGTTASGGVGGRGTGGTGAGGKTGAGGATGMGGATPTGGTTPTGGASVAPNTAPVPSGTPVSVHGQLKVAGNKIVDQNGKTVTLHGMSMYDWSQQGRQFYNASAVGHLAKDFECAILRIPILPQNATSGLSRVKAVADACIANGIYGIIDWHGGSAATAATAAAFFASMAQAYGNTPNIMYEPWNEPTVPWATVKTYHETVVAAIRAVDPDNIIFLGTPQWDQRPDQAAADPVTTSTNLAYVVHFYANSHKLAGFQNAITTTLNKNLAIFVTEYGGCSANGNGTFNATELQKWWDFLDANDIGCTNWAVETNGETSSIFKTNASANGPWTDADLTDPDGVTIINYIKSNYAATMTP
jgi:endoglucanase